jgi:hypothetical protein
MVDPRPDAVRCGVRASGGTSGARLADLARRLAECGVRTTVVASSSGPAVASYTPAPPAGVQLGQLAVTAPEQVRASLSAKSLPGKASQAARWRLDSTRLADPACCPPTLCLGFRRRL